MINPNAKLFFGIALGALCLFSVSTASADGGILEEIILGSAKKASTITADKNETKPYDFPSDEYPALFDGIDACVGLLHPQDDSSSMPRGACAFVRCVYNKLCGGGDEKRLSDPSCLHLANRILALCDWN